MRIKSIHEEKAEIFSKFKQRWVQIGDKKIFARSKWEFYYACYLQFLKDSNLIEDWKHEPTTFWFDGIKRGTNNYKPDFLVIHLDKKLKDEYIEVKGYVTDKDKTKWKRMKKYYPKIQLRVIGQDWFKDNLKKIKLVAKKYIDSYNTTCLDYEKKIS